MQLPPARLLYVTTSTHLGGSERVLARLALSERAHWEAVGVCSLKPVGVVGRELERRGVPISSCGMCDASGARGVLATLTALPALRRAVREFRPTLIHAFLFRAGLLSRVPALRPSPRLVVSIRRLEARGALAHWLDRCTQGAVHRFTAVSEAARRQMARRSGIPVERIEVIPNGVEVSELRSEGGRLQARRRIGGVLPEFLVGSVGRLEPIKNHRLLLESVARLLPEAPGGASGSAPGPGAGLVLVGEGRERAALERAAAAAPLAGRVLFLGERTDIQEILPALDVFVLPSRSEGMSNALLEAMAVGIPAVATRVGGNLEVIEHGVSGLLVEPDQPAALAGAIAGLLFSPERARRIGLAGRERVRRLFSIETMLRRYRELYAGVSGAVFR